MLCRLQARESPATLLEWTRGEAMAAQRGTQPSPRDCSARGTLRSSSGTAFRARCDDSADSVKSLLEGTALKVLCHVAVVKRRRGLTEPVLRTGHPQPRGPQLQDRCQ